jgi:hypothetical protein
MSLHDYFGGRDTSVPAHFILQWRRRSATFARHPPQGMHRVDPGFMWLGKHITLWSDVELVRARAGEAPPAKSLVSLHKSHLQKCVRRSNAHGAVWSAGVLLDVAPDALLRRIPIVMIEDVAPHTCLTVLVWLMASGCQLTVTMHRWILGTVWLLASAPHRDPVPPHHATPPPSTAIVTRTITTLGGGGVHSDLIFAMLLRRSFGGMQGDMEMMGLSAHRSMQQSVVDWAPVTPVDGSPRPPWELAAVDFHICHVVKTLADRTRLAEKTIRRAMWHCSSSSTDKLPAPPEPADMDTLRAVWRECAPHHTRWALAYVYDK